MEYHITKDSILKYRELMKNGERSLGTIKKYMRDLQNFTKWLDGNPVSLATVNGWKESLQDKGYAPVTINSMLSALNGYFEFMEWKDCKVKFLRIQRSMFRERERELTKSDYDRLLHEARKLGKERLEMILETIGSSGIRVSELKYITVEAARKGRADIELKGKIRTILLSSKLLRYTKRNGICSGEIFLTTRGKSLCRQQIWREMKALCRQAKVEESKVFPHNLRHLFAITFYQISRDVVKLADVLGHSSIETTRIYLKTTGEEHIRQLEKMCLII